jgi:uncharacterized protein YwgA
MPIRRKSPKPSQEDVVLAALAPAGGASHTPVQVQKLIFLIEENVAKEIGGTHFDFEPYHYGPFDKEVYSTLDALSSEGLAEISYGPGANWRSYRLTPEGQARGVTILESLDPRAANYIRRVSEFVRRSSFSDLVSAIYKAYPQMRARSVFQD